jgi:hypothetical protein
LIFSLPKSPRRDCEIMTQNTMFYMFCEILD